MDEISPLLDQALRLPPEARAALAGSLLDSLDDETDEDLEQSWAAEIRARLDQLHKGTVRTIPWEEARRSILAD